MRSGWEGGDLAVGEGVAETGEGLHQVVVETPLFHTVLLVIGIPGIMDPVFFPEVANVHGSVLSQPVANQVLPVVLGAVVVAVVDPGGGVEMPFHIGQSFLHIRVGGGVLLWGVKADLESQAVQLLEQLLKILVGFDGGVKSGEHAVAGFPVGDAIGVVVKHAFGHGDAIIHETSDGVFRSGDVFVAEAYRPMGADVGPVGVLGEDDARLIAVGNGHDSRKSFRIHSLVQGKRGVQNVSSLYLPIGDVLKEIFQGVVQRIVDHRVVSPVVQVKVNGPVFGFKLHGGDPCGMVAADGTWSLADGESFAVEVIFGLEQDGVRFVVSAIHHLDGVGEREDQRLP